MKIVGFLDRSRISARDSYDVEDFITGIELDINKEESSFKALVEAKLEQLRIMAYEFRKGLRD